MGSKREWRELGKREVSAPRLDAEVLRAVFVQPPLGLRQLAGAVAHLRRFRRVVVVRGVVLHHIVVLQPARSRIVQLVPAVVAVGGRVPLGSVAPIRCPVVPVPVVPPLRRRVPQ